MSENNVIPLHPSQRNIYFEHLFYNDSAIHNVGGYNVINHDVDVAVYKKSWQLMYQNIDVLRSILVEQENLPPLQKIASPTTNILEVDYIDFSQHGQPKEQALAWMKKEFNTVPYIHSCSNSRIFLLKISENKYYNFNRYHHLFIDGISCLYLSSLFYKIYCCLYKNESVDFLDTLKQYTPYVLKAISYQDSNRFLIDKEYWENKLNKTSILHFRKNYNQTGLSNYTIDLPNVFVRDLAVFCKKNDTNYSALFSTVVGSYFSRIYNMDNITLGLTVHGRPNKASHQVAGMFSNTVPFCFDYLPTQSFNDSIKQSNFILKQSLIHSRFPASESIRLLGIKSRIPIELNYELFNNKQDETTKKTGHIFRVMTNDGDQPLHIRLIDYRSEGKLVLDITYCQQYFMTEEISFLATRLLNMLQAGIENPSLQLSTLPWLSNNEYRTLVHDFNQTDAVFPMNKTLNQLFEEQAALTPDNIAASFETETISYQRLNYLSNQLACKITAEYQKNHKKALEPGVLITLYFERCIEMLISVLAVLKSGGAYVPISPETPIDRTLFMLQDTDSQLILTQSQHLPQLNEVLRRLKYTTLIPVDNYFNMAQESGANLKPVNHETDLAYVIYTSGSTGKPKGVMLQHNSIVNRINWMQSQYPLSKKSRVLQKTPYNFDVSVWELLWANQVGATLIIAPPNAHRDPVQLQALIVENNISVMHFVPTMLSLYCQYLIEHKKTLPICVEQIFCSGEELTKTVIGLFEKVRHNKVFIHNLYGPTEAAIDVSHFDNINKKTSSLLIGQAISNTKLYVLTEDLALVPLGTSGELYISGVCLARGYKNLTEQTKKQFINNPFASKRDKINGYSRLYKTGDIVRHLPDGNLEYLGRNDFQIKIKGHRVELEEIEFILSKITGIKQACVIPINNENNDFSASTLAAFYVLNEVSSKSINATIIHVLTKILPDYMIPSTLLKVDVIPLTLTGKVDRHLLLNLLPLYKEEKINIYVKPENKSQKICCEIWQQVFKIKCVGIDDNFFEIGGNSIIGIQLISKLSKQGYVVPSLRTLFQYPTIRLISPLLSKESSTQSSGKELQAFSLLKSKEVKNHDDFLDGFPASITQQGLIYESLRFGNLINFDVFFCTINQSFNNEKFFNVMNSLVNKYTLMKGIFSLSEENGYNLFVRKKIIIKDHVKVIYGPIITSDKIKTIDFIEEQLLLKKEFNPERLFDFVVISNKDKFSLFGFFHHTITDGWSFNRYFSDFINLYCLNNNVDLHLESTYANFVQLEAKSITNKKHERFWLKYLSKYEPVRPLKWFNATTEIKNDFYSKQNFIIKRLNLSDANKIQSTASKLNVQDKSLFLAAQFCLMASFHQKNDIVIGHVCNNRPIHSEGDAQLGYFLNVIPLRINVDTINIARTIKSIQKGIVVQNDYQIYPSAKIASHYDDELYSSTFDFVQFKEVDHHQNNGLIDDFEDVSYNSSLFLFNVTRHDNQYVITLLIHKSLSDEAASNHLLKYYEFYLEQICSLEMTEFKNIHPEDSKYLALWNDSDRSYPSHQTLHQLFEMQAKKTPNQIAIKFEEQSLTYRELNERANQLAHNIRNRYQEYYQIPLRPDTLIALYLDRSLEMLIGILAVLKAGGAYVPISPEYPQSRTTFILQDTSTPFIITHAHYVVQLTRCCKKNLSENKVNTTRHCQVINLDDDSLVSRACDNLSPISQAIDLAYVIYTSGTTGQPKGVMIEHRSAVNTIISMNDIYNINSNCYRMGWFSNYIFDVSVSEIFNSLCFGGELHLFNEKIRQNPLLLSEYINTHLLHCLFVPPVLLTVLPKHEYLSLQSIIFAGDTCEQKVGEYWANRYALYNYYGPTEASIYASGKKVDASRNVNEIGTAVSNTKLYVLNDYLQRLPVGASGELYISGIGLARGYLNRDVLTLDRFIDNPFATHEDIEKGYSRLYRTGDLVRYLPDGNLEYLGRNDSQIKISGYRIELGEIETALNRVDGIKQAVVINLRGGDNQYLAAYFVSDGSDIDVTAIRQELTTKLPKYMVPSSFTAIDTVPLTLNGKLDRNALPDPDVIDSANYIPPRNEQENLLCDIWQAVLGLERIGIHDNFFRIGGDSMTAIRLSAKGRQSANLDIPLVQLFAHPTIAELAQVLSSELLVIPSSAPTLQSSLSFAQERLWFIERFEQGHATYHMPYLVRLTSHVDTEVLLHSINLIAQRHPVLNSIYRETNKGIGFTELLDKPLSYHTQTVANQLAFETLVKAEVNRPFDLHEQAPLRLCCYDVASQYDKKCERYLLIMPHHIAFDGWSITIFFTELTQTYLSLLEGQKPKLPELSISYSDYAYWQRSYLEGEVLEVELNYWRNKLSGFNTLNLPTKQTRPAQINYRGSNYTCVLEVSLSTQLRALAKSHNTTLYTVMLSGFYLTLSQLCNQQDIVLGTPSDNRHHAQTQSLIGFFVNSLVLRTKVAPELSCLDLITRVHNCIQEAKIHQECPFEKLVSELTLERDISRHPIFQVMFSLQSFGPDLTLNRTLFEEVELTDKQALFCPAKYDVSLFIDDSGKSLTAKWNYALSLFNEIDIKHFAHMYQKALIEMLTNPQQKVGQIELLSTEERHTLVNTWNKTETFYPKNKTIQQLFEAQVHKTPNNIALVFEENELTYRELNEKANQLAHHIRRQYQESYLVPLQADTLIALYLNRGLEMVISILAVLKAGGAYVPISTETPKERVTFILKNSQTTLLLAQSYNEKRLQSWMKEVHTQCHLLLIDHSLVNYPCDNLNVPSKAENLAYVIYTSGTTGQPKGVMVEHKSVINLIKAQMDVFGLNEQDVALQFASYVFDASVSELFVSLSQGHKICVCNETERKDIDVLVELINKHMISVATIPPSLVNIMDLMKIKSLKTLVLAGESPSLGLLKSLNQRYRVFNAYGPTESTVCATVNLYNNGNSASNIGKPIPNIKVYVVNENNTLCPIGTFGELYIGGAGLARGYLNRPELTAARFIDNPFATNADIEKGYTRLYKTGDMVRYLADGNLEFLGRNDSQVKIRGHRIELGEIETALSQISGINQAVVIDHQHVNDDQYELSEHKSANGQYLAAYVVTEAVVEDVDADTFLTPETDTYIEGVRQQLTRVLPDYMQPATFTLIESVPLTINGKLDRKALPEPEFIKSDTYVAPRNETEKQLCEIWQAVLGLEQVGIHDNFFRIGGDSISAIKLIAAIRSELNVDIPLSTLFSWPQIALFCDWLDKEQCPNDLLKALTLNSNAEQKLFMIHPAIAGCEVYVPLALALSDIVNCIGIDNYNFSSEVKISSLQQMAVIYADQILSQTSIDQPIGLLGWSLGGQLALEISYLLESRGAKDIKVFLLDTIINSEHLLRLRKQLKMPSLLEMKTKCHDLGITDSSYIEKILQAHPFEEAMSQCELSSKLNHAKVTLFKAGLVNKYIGNKDSISFKINKLISKLPDNNVSQWVNKPITIKLINDKNHINIVESIEEIREEILNDLVQNEDIKLI
ncbi:non-ribosomal peptide synthetase [Shewanella surugensis]|uniref:Amino acid adenylation domain-containing protein n=1 Tax=Shewanella surugensis TaxID=212020 RepID=A0ABT0LFV3_9GAMM|nr:non-ribosomal peptide synthetase [Shewanella surugensis]MCL1126596.1 amino acid adenylation domain-containing protein [Shewanella surugensis]